VLKEAPATYEDLLDPKFKQKLQYSTPGQAGDGTAMMLQAFHAFGSKEKGLDFLKKLQANNLGPSASTGKLTALVNKGELYVANGDMQMNTAQSADNPNIKIFFPAGPDGRRRRSRCLTTSPWSMAGRTPRTARSWSISCCPLTRRRTSVPSPRAFPSAPTSSRTTTISRT